MSKRLARPEYEALNDQGYTYLREAREIGELDVSERRAAINAAVPVISDKLGLAPVAPLSSGLPVYTAFGLKPGQAKRHSEAQLLLTKGIDLSLDLVPIYLPAKPQPAGQ